MIERSPLDATPRATAKRIDAERNRDKILAAARSAFAVSDGEVSMAEISRRAGVGMATLYRNFASRRDLLETLYTDEVNAICKAAAEAIDGKTPEAALQAWIQRFFAFVRAKRHVAAELLEHCGHSNSVFTESRARVLAAGRPILAAAQAKHEIRDDVTLEQVLDLVVAIAKIHGESRYIEPILETAIDGLRLGATRSSPKRNETTVQT